MRAVLLGGGKCNVALASITQEKYKARVKLRNKSMIDYTIEALLQSKSIDSIDVYTEKEITNEIPIDKSIKVYYSKKSPIENILDFIYKNSETLKNTSFLICTSDLPLLKSETIDEFIKLAVESKRKFVMPLVHKKEIIKKFPSIKRTYLTINKQEWCGGNIFLSEKDFFLRNAELGEMYAAR